MIAKKDLDNLRKELKEDIETAVAQIMESIVKLVATKEDLKFLAAKDDLKAFAAKDDLKNTETRLSNEIKDVKRQIDDLKADTPAPQEFADHEKRISKLENGVLPS